MGVNSVNDAGSVYGAAFRDKPIYLMTIKESNAFFEGKMRKNMVLQEDTCTLSSNNTYIFVNPLTFQSYLQDSLSKTQYNLPLLVKGLFYLFDAHS